MIWWLTIARMENDVVIGGVDKRKMAEGGQAIQDGADAAIAGRSKAAVNYRVRPRHPAGCSWAEVCRYCRLFAQVTGWLQA